MPRQLTSAALLLMLAFPPATAEAKSTAKQTGALSLADLSSFKVKPAELQQKLDRALMQNPNSVPLNFLRGLIYDSSSPIGSEGRQLAKVGYLTALRADPTYWPASYQLGLLAMDDGDSVSAERSFMAAAIFAEDEPRIFYALARASYCSGNIGNARVALERAIALQAPSRDEDYVTAALVTAAAGDKGEAQRWLEKVSYAPGGFASRNLQGRVAKLSLSSGSLADGAGANTGTAPAATTVPDRKMATVDVVIVRRQEDRATSTGINLMDVLTLQFGSSLINSERTKVTDRLSGSTISDAVTTVQNVNLTIPSVTYSLNIANAMGSNSSIEARQTLLVYNGVTSKVFSGGTLTYASSGQMSAQSFTKEVGLSLTVTPKFISRDTVSLTINTAMETFLNNDAVGSFSESVQTEKSSSDITLDMNFGETVFVSGGRFANFEATRSRTPVLGSVPVIGNLFSNRRSAYAKNDLLIILSMRRDGGRQDRRSAEELELIDRLAESLWQKLGIVTPDQILRIDSEDHRPYYDLENAGRSFNRGYLDRIGLDEVLQRL
ncbi:MAG: hypothetical protein RLZZ415_109 [Pseudomonadota bacterium]